MHVTVRSSNECNSVLSEFNLVLSEFTAMAEDRTADLENLSIDRSELPRSKWGMLLWLLLIAVIGGVSYIG